MPGTPNPVGRGPAGEPVFWNAVLGAIKGTQQAVNGLAGGAPAGWVADQYGNITQVSGSNLNQVVTIGAAYQQAGVQVSTGLAGGTAGTATLSGPAITTIALTKGSTSATVGTVTGASLAIGQVIGAALVNDPTTGTPTPAITPGTTIANISGSTVTLSQNAAESGTGLYCAAARYILQQDTGWLPITLASGFGNITGFNPASVRLIGDEVRLRGAIQVNSGSSAIWGTLPTVAKPAVFVQFGANIGTGGGGLATAPFGGVNTSGQLVSNGTTSVGWQMYLEGATYSLS